LSNELDKLISDFSKIEQEFHTLIQNKFRVILTDFFVKFPEFRSIEWTQYTPSFCDGDPCSFTKGEIYYTLEPDLGYYTEEEAEVIRENDYTISDLEEYHPLNVPSKWEREYAATSSSYRARVNAYDNLPAEKRAELERLDTALQALMKAINKVPGDILSAAFGDGVVVRAFKDSISIDEYDCGY
jgi:hypothetical protein